MSVSGTLIINMNLYLYKYWHMPASWGLQRTCHEAQQPTLHFSLKWANLPVTVNEYKCWVYKYGCNNSRYNSNRPLTQGRPLPKIRGTRFIVSALKSIVQELSNGIWHAHIWSNIWMSYTVGKLLNPAFQYMCQLWQTWGTRTCIRVHVMGALVTCSYTQDSVLLKVVNGRIVYVWNPVYFCKKGGGYVKVTFP